MCFSASASFGAAIVLSAISVSTIKKTQQPSQLYFAIIPLIFCLQQISEGFLWLSLTNPSYASLQQPMTYIFLFFAQILWPDRCVLIFLAFKNSSIILAVPSSSLLKEGHAMSAHNKAFASKKRASEEFMAGCLFQGLQ